MNRYLDAIFCDDMRQEVTGKSILIGVYSSIMIVGSYPTTLPQLCVVIKAVSPAKHPFSELTVRLYQDEKVLSEVTVDSDQLSVFAETAQAECDNHISEFPGGTERLQTIRLLSTMRNVVLNNDCVIRVRAQTESEEIKTGGLRVKVSESQEPEK